jgi:hypothetical protein
MALKRNGVPTAHIIMTNRLPPVESTESDGTVARHDDQPSSENPCRCCKVTSHISTPTVDSSPTVEPRCRANTRHVTHHVVMLCCRFAPGADAPAERPTCTHRSMLSSQPSCQNASVLRPHAYLILRNQPGRWAQVNSQSSGTSALAPSCTVS